MKRKNNETSRRQLSTRDLQKRIETLEAVLLEKETVEAALRESESRYRTLVENLNGVIYTLDTNGCFTYISPAIEQHSAYKVNDIIGRNFSELVHPDDLLRLRESLSRMIRTETEPFEFRVFDRDGQVRYIRSASQPSYHEGLIVGITGLMTDITERKRTEEALEESREKYRGLSEATFEAIFISEKGLCIEQNQTAEKIFGYTSEEAVGRYGTEWIATEDREMVMKNMVTGYEEPYEATASRKDGTTFPCMLRGKMMRYKGRTVRVTSLSDITERKQAEAELRESEARYRALFQQASDGIFYLSTDLKISAVNESFARMHGYRVEEMQNMRLQDLDTPESTRLSPDRVRRVMAGEVIEFEVEHYHHAGHVFPLAVSTGLISIGGKQFIQAFHRDITKRKQAEEALRESEERFRTLLQNVQSVAVQGYGMDGTTQYWNQASERLYGYPAQEALGRNLLDLIIPPEMREGVRHAIRQMSETGQPIPASDLVLMRKDGSRVAVFSSHATVQRPGLGPELFCLDIDLTARKALEAENQKLTEQFYQAQKLESIGQLAGGIAHDFNNLLVPIIGYAELGLTAAPPESKLYTHFSRIKGAGERAAGLTRQILAFSRRQVLEMKMVDLNQVISGFEEMLRRLIGENIIWQTDLAADLPAIKADQGQLEQILLNLVVNARDAMPQGGRLTLETAQVVLAEAEVARHLEAQPGPHVRLTVSDTGHGIDTATQQRIFEPFFTTKERGQGTGLGLSTVFGIVKQHGGSIEVSSEPGQGTAFKVYLPVDETAVAPGRPAGPADGVLEGIETVLVVEDEAAVRQLVSATLREYGYRVLEAGDPPWALALAAAHSGPIHLLLTDVILPVMTGRELYRQLSGGRPGLKVLYISGYPDNAIAPHDVSHEGTAFLQKPFAIRSLLEKVRAALG